MNKVLGFLILVLGGSAQAVEVKIFKDVDISICAAQLEGCASYMTTSAGSGYLVDQDYAKSFLKKHKHLTAETTKNISVKEVMGVVVKERGHFPNPMAEFTVIKAISIIE